MTKKYFFDTIEEENIGYHEKTPLIKLFYKLKFKIAIKYANLKKDDLILDFGCGTNWLKKNMLPEYNMVGYDIDPKLTEIKDYKKVKPDKIIVFDVFEHIEKKGIRRIIKNFKEMSPNFTLVTIIPTETWFWRKSRKLLGLSETVADHITPLKEILKILGEELNWVRQVNFFGISHISKWKK